MKKFVIVLIAVLVGGVTACETTEKQDQTGSACTIDADCGGELACWQNACVNLSEITACDDNEDCQENEYCDSSSKTCNPLDDGDGADDGDDDAECEEDADCDEGETCQEDICAGGDEPSTVVFPSESAMEDFVCFNAYSATLKVVGGSGKYSWKVDGLPKGITHNASSSAYLKFSGQMTTCDIGAATISVTVSDAEDPANSTSKAFKLQKKANKISVSSSSCQFSAAGGEACELSASGGSNEFTYHVVANTSLPSNVSLNPSAADAKKWELVATPPVEVGEFTTLIRACDKNIKDLCSDAKELKITVSDILKIEAYTSKAGVWQLINTVTYDYDNDTATVSDFSFQVDVKDDKVIKSLEDVLLQAGGTVPLDDETDGEKFKWKVVEGDEYFSIESAVSISSQAYLYVKDMASDAATKNVKVQVTSPTGQTAYIVFNKVNIDGTNVTCESASPKLMVMDGKTEIEPSKYYKDKEFVLGGSLLDNLKVIDGKGPYEVNIKIQKGDYGEMKKDQWKVAKNADGMYALSGFFKYKFNKKFADKTIKMTTIKSTITMTVKDKGCGVEKTFDITLNVKLPSPNDEDGAGAYSTLFSSKDLQANSVIYVDDDGEDDAAWIQAFDKDEKLLGETSKTKMSGEGFEIAALVTGGGAWSKLTINKPIDLDDKSINYIRYVGYHINDDCPYKIYNACYDIDFDVEAIILVNDYYYLYVFDNWDADGEGHEEYYCPVGAAKKGSGDHGCHGDKFYWRLRCDPDAESSNKPCGIDADD